MVSTSVVRRSALVLTLALLGGVLALGPGATPAQATDAFAITRLAGGDRAATAAAIALATFPAPDGADTVLIARDDTFPDALAGNYSAGLLSAPLLLTSRTALPPSTRSAITTLGAQAAVVLGGTGAVAQSVVEELLGMGLTVSRVGGADRYATAAQLAVAAGPAAVGRNENTLKTAVLSSGENFPDALAAGPMVYRQHFPQLLTGPGTIPAVTLQALRNLGIEHVIITGGALAVAADMETQLANAGFLSVERIAGNTRYATALALVNKMARAFDFGVTHVDFATGENFPDALAGGPHAGRDLSPIMLVPPTVGSTDFTTVCDTLQFIAPVINVGHALGGPGALPDDVLTALTACGKPVPPVSTGGQVVRVSLGVDQYTFVDRVDEAVRVVNYDDQDLYYVDGDLRTVFEFEAAITPGDDVTYDDDVSRVNRDVHRLTNKTITQGLVGNIDTTSTNRTLAILNPVTADVVGGPYRWDEAGDSFTIDAATGQTRVAFEGNLNEGDQINITLTDGNPSAFGLTNAALAGTITSRSAANQEFATFNVDDVFGDDPEAFQNNVFRADKTPPAGTAEVYVIDGLPAIDFAQFNLLLSIGDGISVSRTVVGGVPTERFALTNRNPQQVSGQVTGFFNLVDDPSPSDPSGDRIAVVPSTGGYQSVDYTGTLLQNFFVDGLPVDEEDFEAAVSPGDRLTFQPGSTSPAVTETLRLTNAPLSGQLYAIAPAIDLYGVYAADDNTLLALVAYAAAGDPPLTNQYFFNGQELAIGDWENRAADIDVSAGDLDDEITMEVSGSHRNHRITTTDPVG